MSTMTKRLLGFALALVMVIGLFPVFELEAKAENPTPTPTPAIPTAPTAPEGINEPLTTAADAGTINAPCKACGAASVDWEPLTANTSAVIGEETHKHYYVPVGGIEVTKTITTTQNKGNHWFYLYSNAGVCVHLNGQNLTTAGNAFVSDAATFNLMGTGNWVTKFYNTAYTYHGSAINAWGRNVNVNLYGGVLSLAETGATRIVGFPADHANTDESIGINIYPDVTLNGALYQCGGRINMYGGTWNGAISIDTYVFSTGLHTVTDFNLYNGTINGAVTVNSGTFDMNGGIINGKVSVKNAKWTFCSDTTFTMKAGTINNSIAVERKNLADNDGVVLFDMQGGTVNGYNNANNADSGTAFRLKEGAKLKISGGTVNGGQMKAGSGWGGTIYASPVSVANTAKTEIEMTGGTINAYGWDQESKPVASNQAGTIYLWGTGSSGQYATTGGGVKMTISGGTINGGKTGTDGNGGSIYVNGAVVEMSGGTIQGGEAKYGGNVFVSDIAGSSFTMTGGTVTGGKATGMGGNIYTTGVNTVCNLTNATVSYGTAPEAGNIGITSTRANITNSTVSYGEATTSADTGYSGGGNLLIKGTGNVVNVTGTVITNGRAKAGANVLVLSLATVNLGASTEIKEGNATGWNGGGAANTSGGTINIQGAHIHDNISYKEEVGALKQICAYYGGKVVMDSGTLGDQDDQANFVVYLDNSKDQASTAAAAPNSQLIVNGGTVGQAVYTEANGTITYNDGVFYGKKAVLKPANVTIHHGEFHYTDAGVADLVAADAEMVKEGNTYYVHNRGAQEDYKKNTCTEDGYTSFKCTTCQAVYTPITTEATDHAYVYTNKGETHDVTCENCTEYSETGVAHTYGENDTCVCGAVASYEATVGDQKYPTLQEALDAAKVQGGTVKLAGAVTVDEIEIRDGVTLDLNGQKLTVNGMVMAAFNTSYIVDNSADNAGRLVMDVEDLRLLPTNAQLPVQMDDGIAFVNVEFTDGWYEDEHMYGFWLEAEKNEQTLLQALNGRTAEEAGLTLRVALKWDDDGALTYEYTQELIDKYLENYPNYAFQLRVHGVENVTGLTYQAQIVFAKGTLAEVVYTIEPMAHK